MAPIDAIGAGIPGEWVSARRAKFIVQRGVGDNSTGQGEDPVLICSVSNDGGFTFSPETFVKIGRQGDFLQEVVYNRRVKGRTLVYRVRMTDPNYLVLYAGSVEVEALKRHA